MAEITNLERGWTLYHEAKPNGSKSWTLHDPDGEERATYLREPEIDRLNGYTQGFEAGMRNGIIDGRQQQAKLTSQALHKLMDGYTGDIS